MNKLRALPTKTAVLAVALASSGCAFQYYDESTGTQHLYGFGHLRMKVSRDSTSPTAVVTGTRSCGIGAGTAAGGGYALIGWQDLRTIEVLAEDSQLSLEWPTNDFFSVRVGTGFPHSESTTIDSNSRQSNETR